LKKCNDYLITITAVFSRQSLPFLRYYRTVLAKLPLPFPLTVITAVTVYNRVWCVQRVTFIQPWEMRSKKCIWLTDS